MADVVSIRTGDAPAELSQAQIEAIHTLSDAIREVEAGHLADVLFVKHYTGASPRGDVWDTSWQVSTPSVLTIVGAIEHLKRSLFEYYSHADQDTKGS